MDNVGTGPAGLTSYLALLTFKPDLLITSGTAGGFKAQGAAIADIFLGTKFINHDRRNPIPVCPLIWSGPLPSGQAECQCTCTAWTQSMCCSAKLHLTSIYSMRR